MNSIQTRLLSRSDLFAACEEFRRAYKFSRQWDRMVKEAIALHGERNSTHISGIYSDHFPQKTQNDLRADGNLFCA